MSNKPTLVVEDFTDKLRDIVKKFRKDTVLVGIPEADNTRDEAGTELGNAGILAMNNFGTQHIPGWPVLEIGIRSAQDAIADAFADGARKALSEGFSALSPAYNKVGIIASNAVKKVINSQEGAPPLADATLAAREAKGFKGTKRLIVTGQVRNAITYVVRGES